MSAPIIPFPRCLPRDMTADDAHRSVQEDGLPDAKVTDVILVISLRSGRYHVTRFVWGHEDGCYRFDTRQEAIAAADMCRHLCGVAIINEISGAPAQ